MLNKIKRILLKQIIVASIKNQCLKLTNHFDNITYQINYSMKYIIKYILFVLLTFYFIACDEKVQNDKDPSELAPSLSDEIVIDEDLNISYQIPSNWEQMPASLSEKFVARLSGKDKNNLIVYSPKSFYYDQTSASLLRVGKVSLKDNSLPEALTIENYISQFKKYNTDLTVESGTLQLNPIKIIQLKIEKGKHVSYKIIFQNNLKEIIQLDFSVTKENINKFKSSIYASIHSIKLL